MATNTRIIRSLRQVAALRRKALRPVDIEDAFFTKAYPGASTVGAELSALDRQIRKEDSLFGAQGKFEP